MIVVRLELWPGGCEGRAKEIGRAYIANTGEGTERRGDYEAQVCRRGQHHVQGAPARTGEVHGFPRLSYNVWRLIIRALKSCFPEEQGAPGRKLTKDELRAQAAGYGKRVYAQRRAAGLCTNCAGPTDHRSLCRPCADYINPQKNAYLRKRKGLPVGCES